jgi:hypothetical protein
MQPSQTKARSCRSPAIGLRLEREILALRVVGAKLEEAVVDLTRPVAPLFGRKASGRARRGNAARLKGQT